MPRRGGLLCSLTLLAALDIGCGARCEVGFEEINGVCVDYDVNDDGGPRPTVDAGLRPDAGSPSDSGPAPDAGLVVDAGPAPDGGAVMPGAPGRLLIRAAAVLPMRDAQVIYDGEVYVAGGRIQCLGPRGACTAEAAGASVIEHDGVLLPGLVDAHNHVAYNFLPEWMAERFFDDSGQWRSNGDYSDFVAPYRENKGDRDSFCAMVQWGEVMALANGTTTTIGAPQPRTCFRWLVRNAELSTGYNGFEADRMRTNTLGIDVVDMDDAASIIAAMDAGDVTAYVVHLAEGLSTRARGEFLEMRSLGLLREEAVLIHATGLEPADFAEVAAVGAKVVWSPSSNMALYDDTTNVQAALQAGVSVSISPDWTPSGTDNLFDELRFAEALVQERWPDMLGPEDYVAMVTRVPAEQLGLAREVGTLQVGLHADLLLLDGDAMRPFRAVIDAEPQDIRMVVIGGVPSYGDPEILGVLPDTPASCHEVFACTVARSACWADTPEGPVTLEQISGRIQSFASDGPEPLVDCQ